jgi:cell wall-associated NlpC family hydrolase
MSTSVPLRVIARWVIILALTVTAFLVAYPSHAAASTTPRRIVAIQWAITHETGHWYCWAGAGPSCYDCSGAVMTAYAHAGIALPHSTYMMIASWHLVQIPASQAQRGDLAFYGSGHVELVTKWPNVTFGAQDFGTRVGWHRSSIWWHPTMYFRVR